MTWHLTCDRSLTRPTIILGVWTCSNSTMSNLRTPKMVPPSGIPPELPRP